MKRSQGKHKRGVRGKLDVSEKKSCMIVANREKGGGTCSACVDSVAWEPLF